MNSFANLLYPLQNIPVMLHTKDIHKLNKALTGFLWKGSPAKIAMKKLWLPKAQGGINLPNIRLYNIICLFRHSMDWVMDTSTFSNLSVEKAMAHPLDLSTLLHVPSSRLPRGLKNNVILKDTIVAWQSVRRELKLPITISAHLLILGNPQFPQGGLQQVYHLLG